jgi:V8-like Glu-specific endopeptidase
MAESDIVFTQIEGCLAECSESRVARLFSVSLNFLKDVCGVYPDRNKVGTATILPYKAICKLYICWEPGDMEPGTGWLVHQDKLYTAGHCVRKRDYRKWAKSIVVVPAMAGLNEPYGRYQAIALATTQGWIDSGTLRYDMGAIKLAAPVRSTDVLTPVVADPPTGKVCGYPKEMSTGVFQYEQSGSLTKENGQFKYEIDTSVGQSGSPLLMDQTQAVGIHHSGGCPNRASALYRQFIDDIARW